jgi:DNA-binding NtrC family response regulator
VQPELAQTLKSDLHEADIESLERRLAQMALEQTGARHGAIFLWDEENESLVLDFHVVDTVVVALPGGVVRRREDGRPGGIALWVAERNEPYLCTDTSRDPNYAPYFLEVGSIAAVPIAYQQRAIGVITVSADAPGAFDRSDIERLQALAEPAAMFLRRAQLYRKSRAAGGRPFLIKGLSREWLEVERRLERVSPTHAPVLIHGESGTGKELVAHAIHFNSRRAEKPFVTVNCAAIPETMLESVLFGHVKGAFTGATFDKVGEFQKADGGTLFLDEVGELPLALQAKVLRALDQGEVSPLGSNKPALRVDVRVLCATHRDLPRMVDDGLFRQDLYFRLGVMTMELPALREYKDNLPVLASVFLQQAAQRHGTPSTRLSPEAIAALRAHDFPGNVRELRNAIEHAVIMAGGEPIRAEHLPASIGGVATPRERPRPVGEPTLKELRERWLAPLERQYLTELLSRCEGNVARAAEVAGMNTVTLYRLLKRRGLKLGRLVRPAEEER